VIISEIFREAILNGWAGKKQNHVDTGQLDWGHSKYPMSGRLACII